MKKKTKIFISYARANKELTKRFLDKFKEQVAPSKKYKYVFWDDSEIIVGEKWHDEIQNALSECNMGLLLVSPAFLASQYIEENELPKFIRNKSKPILPVMLQTVDFKRHDLKGLQKTQIFMLDNTRFQSSKSYGDCSSQQRIQFVQELFKQVEKKLDKIK